MIVIDISEAHNIAKLISHKLNQMGNLCNVYNLFEDEIKNVELENWIEDKFLFLLIQIDNNYTVTISNPSFVNIGLKQYNKLFEDDRKYDKLSELVNAMKEEYVAFSNSTPTLAGIFLGYYAYWNSLLNIRSLNIIIKEGKNQKAFNFVVYAWYNEFINSNSLQDFLSGTLDLYFNGYIIGNDIFWNLFMGRVRLYCWLKKTDPDKITISEFNEAILDTEMLGNKENKKIVTDAFKALVSFCNKKLRECLQAENEAELMLAHGKMSGLVATIRKLFSYYDFLGNNAVLTTYKDIFEEIQCDCFAIKTGSSFSPCECPKYSHWILFVIFSDNEEDYDRLFSVAGERLFLSERVRNYLQSENPLPENRRKILQFINTNFKDIDLRATIPIAKLKKYDSRFMRKILFEEEDFKREYENIAAYDESVYKAYIDLGSVLSNKIDTQLKESIIYIHEKLVIEDFKDLIGFNSLTGTSYDNKLDVNYEMERIYPFSSNIKQEIAILLDHNNSTGKALSTILEALMLEFDNHFLWQSFAVICKKLNLHKEIEIAAIAYHITNIDNNEYTSI